MDCFKLSNSFRWIALYAFLCGLACLQPKVLQAGHISGVDLTYECMNGCTVRVVFKAYRDCSSTIGNVSPIGTMAITADTNCIMPTQLGPWLNVSNFEVTPVCPGTPTTCNTPGAAINGIMEHHWIADFDFCNSNCANYTIRWQTCCRNSAINTLSVPASVGLYASATINPLLIPCNSSPVFNTPPVLILCQGQSYLFSQGVTDPDGDSLVYSLGTCMSDSLNPVPYVSFANPNLPLGPNWMVNLDPLTGDLSIAPDPGGAQPGAIQVGVMCVYVQEWRNGQLINTIVRDLQLTVVPCTANDPPTTLGLFNLSGGIELNHFAVSTCLGANVCFDFRVLDSDLGQIQTVRWNQSLATLGATFSLSTNSAIQDTIIGQQPTIRFCWTPTAVGTYNFTVIMHDDACPIYGISQYTFQIEVTQLSVSVTDSVIGCRFVSFCPQLSTDGHYPYQYLWSGSGGLSSNPGHLDSCLTHTYPASGSYTYNLNIQDAIGCSANWQDTIVIPNNVVADAGPDMSTCSNQPIVIGVPPQPSPLLLYSWRPPLGLTNGNSSQATVTLSNNTTAATSQAYILGVMDTATYCIDYDTMQLTIYPLPASPFSLPDSACQYQNITTVYQGYNGPSANYSWTFAGGNPSTATGQGPHQVSWNSPGRHEVTLTVEENGCFSPIERDTIFIRTNPTALILPVANQCLNGNAFNFGNYGVFGSTATHHWNFWSNATPSSSNQQNPTGIIFSTDGPKWITATTTENGCTSLTDSLMIEVYPDPDAVWAVQGGIQCFQGNSYHFTANAGNGPTAIYNWSFQNGIPATSSDTVPIVSFLSPGAHVVTLSVNAFGCTSTYTDTIVVYPEPIVVAGPAAAFCEGDGGATIQALASGGTAPYYYAWSCGGICGIDSTNDDDPLVNPSQTMLYYINVTDFNGCERNLDSVLVTVHPKPTVNAGPDHYLCGDAAPCEILTPAVVGTGPFTFEWFPATGLNDSSLFNPCARPDTTTIYVLVATELSTGCSSDYNTVDTTSSVIVHVNPVPIANAGPDIQACDGDTAVLQGFGFGAGPIYRYEWTPYTGLSNPSIPNPIANPPMSTAYSFTVWSNGCPSIADTVLFNVHTMPSVDAGWDREICLGESTLLDASAAGDSTAQYSFHWSTSLGLNDPFIEDPVATPLTSVTYFVVATSNWGCRSVADSVEVRLRPTPIARAGLDTTICAGQSLHLAGGYIYGATDSVNNPSQIQYAWTTHGQTLADSMLPNPFITPTQSGLYLLQVSYATCKTLDSVLVQVIPPLHAEILADTSTICSGDSLVLHAIGGLGNPIYHWSPAQVLDDSASASPTVVGLDSTVVTLILSEAGCADTSTFSLNVIPSPSTSFLHSPASGCAPLSISLLENSSTSIAYVWNFGDGSPVSNQASPVHTYAVAGDYNLVLEGTHVGGCKSQSEGLLVHVIEAGQPQIQTVPTAPTILYLPQANIVVEDLDPNARVWTWDFADGMQATGPRAVHQFQATGSYMVTLHSQNAEGCMVQAQVGPFEVRLPDLFIPNVFSPNGDGINDVWHADYTGDQAFFVEVRDRWGVLQFQTMNKLKSWDGILGGQAVPEGVYFYYLRISDKEYTGEITLLR